jgi:hypothetical protein
MENTMRSNKAIIVLWTPGCNDGADLAARSAWLAQAIATGETKKRLALKPQGAIRSLAFMPLAQMENARNNE